jgi:hypothetical protein
MAVSSTSSTGVRPLEEPECAQKARDDAAIRVGNHGAQDNAAGLWIDAVVQRFDIAAVRESRFVAQLEFHRHLAIAIGGELPALAQRIETEEGVLVHVGIDVNRVDGDDGGEQGGAAGHAVDVIADS